MGWGVGGMGYGVGSRNIGYGVGSREGVGVCMG